MDKKGFLSKKQMDYLEEIGFNMDKCDGWIETISGSKTLYFSSIRSPFDEPEDFNYSYHTISLGKLFSILPKSINNYRLSIRVMPDNYYKIGYFDNNYSALSSIKSRELKDGLYIILLDLIENGFLNKLIKQKKKK